MDGRKFVQRVLGGQRTLLQQLLDTDAPHVSLPWLCETSKRHRSFSAETTGLMELKGNRRVLDFFPGITIGRLSGKVPVSRADLYVFGALTSFRSQHKLFSRC